MAIFLSTSTFLLIYRLIILLSYKKFSLQPLYYLTGSDWVDPNDPNVIAEQELLAAAASIEAAAKKLAQLRPRQKPKVGIIAS